MAVSGAVEALNMVARNTRRRREGAGDQGGH
jgi:hypothetical protein